MFWTILKWAGTAALILIVVVAALTTDETKTTNQPGPQLNQGDLQQPAKKFNF